MNASIGIRSLLLFVCLASAVSAQQIQVNITNLAPANGNFLTPVWVGIHDGTFDTYDRGAAASAHLERIAEDGSTGPLTTAFSASAGGLFQATIPGPNGPIAPGDTATTMIDLGGPANAARYFSYVSMIIPSNDGFVSNGNPLAHQIIDGSGAFLGADFLVLGSQVLDAGTEVNDEVPANTAFFGQTVPNTGGVQGGLVEFHTGFLPASSGGILADPKFGSANFLAQGYQVAHVTVTLVPEPTSLVAIVFAIGACVVVRRRRVSRR